MVATHISPSLKERLLAVIQHLEAGRIDEAKKAFQDLRITDTAEHLSQPKSVRHLVWDMYEYLIASNSSYASRQEIIESFHHIFDCEAVQ